MENKKARIRETQTRIFARYFCRFIRTSFLLIPPCTCARASQAAIAFAIPLALVFLAACGKSSSAKFNQYYAQGERLYNKHCSNCHQHDGSGLGRLYPPLNSADYMTSNFEEVICLMRYGKTGEMVVNGLQFNQPMPGIPALSDLEIAEIATYIYNTWTHERGLVDVREVAEVMEQCPSGQ